MNISFKWGSNDHAFPQSNQYILDEMNAYIIGDRTNRQTFLEKLGGAIDHLPMKNPELKEENLVKEFKNQFKVLFNKALDTKLTPTLKANTGAWDKFAYGKIVAGSGDSKPPLNEQRVKYADKLTFGSLMDLEIKDNLMSEGGFSHGVKGVPDFDFDDWLSVFSNRARGEDIFDEESAAVEVILRPNSKGNKYQYSHNKEVNNEEAHIVGHLPAKGIGEKGGGISDRNINALIDAQQQWITEQTGSSADFISKTEKISLSFKEFIEYPINIDASKNSKLMPQVASIGKKTNFWRQEIEENKHGKWMPIGDKEYINDGEELGLWLPKVMSPDDTKAGGQNPKELSDDNRYIDEGKNYKFYLDSGKVAEALAPPELKEIELRWGVDDPESPYSFLDDNMDLFKAILQGPLNDPLEVYTVKILGNIKLGATQPKTLGETMIAQNKKPITEDNPEQDRYQLLRGFKRTTGKNSRMISADKYKALTDNQKYIYVSKVGKKRGMPATILSSRFKELSPEKRANYEKKDAYEIVWENMSNKEITEASNKAFKLRTDMSKTISEKEYRELDFQEQKKYMINLTAFNTDGSLTIQTPRDKGEMSYSSSGGLKPDEVVARFKDCFIMTQFELIKHGHFNTTPLGLKGVNLEMKKLINLLTYNIKALNNKLPKGD